MIDGMQKYNKIMKKGEADPAMVLRSVESEAEA